MKSSYQRKLNFEELEQSRVYKIFQRAIKAPKTRYIYKFPLREFLNYANFSNYDQLVECGTEKIQSLLENWIMDMADRGLRSSSIRSKLASVELFLEMNKVIYHKKILHKLIPRDEGVSGGEVPFTTEEINRMLQCTTKLRTKALIHFLASTGARPAAIADPVIKMKHLTRMENGSLAIRIYDNSKEGYWAFLTPEATKALFDYFNSRKNNGEEFSDETPIFVNQGKNKKFEHLTDINLKQTLRNLLKVSGIARKKDGNRYDKATTYGFRKRFNGILKMNNSVNSNIAEKLMAHKNGLDGSYLKPTLEQCYAEFVKAIPELTIGDSERAKIDIKRKDEKINELEVKNKQIDELEKRIDELEHGSEARSMDMAKRILHALKGEPLVALTSSQFVLSEALFPEDDKRESHRLKEKVDWPWGNVKSLHGNNT